MNKKGILFTAMSLLLLIAIVFASSRYFSSTPKAQAEVNENRIVSLNAIVQDVEELYVDLILRNVSLTVLRDLPMQSSRGGFESNIEPFLLLEARKQFSVLTNILHDTDAVDVSFSIGSISLTQENHNELTIMSSLNYTVTEWDTINNRVREDSLGVWKKRLGNGTVHHIAHVDLDGFLMPQTGTTLRFTSSDSLDNAILGGYVFYDEESPSYLERFWDLDVHSECCGVSMILNSSFSSLGSSTTPCNSDIDSDYIGRRTVDVSKKYDTVESVWLTPSMQSYFSLPVNTGECPTT